MRYVMKAGVLACAGMATTAMAQPVETITYSIEWDLSVISGGANTGAVYAEVTPAIGTQTAWNTAPGNGLAGTLKAFASSVFDLVNVSNGTWGTLNWVVPDSWNIAKVPGTPDGNGGIKGTNAGQFGPPVNPAPNVSEKVKILELTWTFNGPPGGYDVKFATKATSAKVYLDVGLVGWVGENAVKTDGEGGFAVVTPAPTVASVIGIAGACAMRRRRRG